MCLGSRDKSMFRCIQCIFFAACSVPPRESTNKKKICEKIASHPLYTFIKLKETIHFFSSLFLFTVIWHAITTHYHLCVVIVKFLHRERTCLRCCYISLESNNNANVFIWPITCKRKLIPARKCVSSYEAFPMWCAMTRHSRNIFI